MLDDRLPRKIHEATAFIGRHFLLRPPVGVILGTGQGQLAQEIQADLVVPYREVPHFPHCTALGHRGQLLCGTLAGTAVIVLNGRFHLYEGYSVEQITFPLHVMHRLGCRLLIVGNASGGINPSLHSGDLVLIDSHIDLMWQRVGLPPVGGLPPDRRGHYRGALYDPRLIERSLAIARAGDFVAHRGVYVGVTGPNYETRAEYRLFRKIGGDVVGMSTVPEVTIASQLEMRVLGISTVANVALPDVSVQTSAPEVVSAAESAAPHVLRIVRQIIAEVAAS